MKDLSATQIRIALADDDPDVRAIFVRLLEALGHRVVCQATNGEELIDKCGDGEVDLVFVDLDMPVMDGLATAEHFSTKGIPVVLVSGHPDAEEVVLEHEPFVSRIRKPASVDVIKQAIRHALSTG